MGKDWAGGKQLVPRRTCETCSAQFYAPPCLIRRGGGRFCSKPCKGVAMSHGVIWGGRRRGLAGVRPDLGDVCFRSSWEADWARQLEFWKVHGNVTRWEYEPESFLLPFKGGARRYVPDFKVWYPGTIIEYHEVKAVVDSRWRQALRGMRRFHPHVRLRVVDGRCIALLHETMTAHIAGLEASTGQRAVRRAARLAQAVA
jgi:hypothetical protein